MNCFPRYLHPVFQQKPRHPLEFAQIIRHQRQAITARMRGDVEIVEANRLASFFKFSPDISIVPGGRDVC